MKNRFGKHRQTLPSIESRFPWFLVSAIALVGTAMRALLLFSTTLVPGVNGAYYLVQARSLIEHGKLGIPDLPLTFAVQAAFAKVVQWISGGTLETSILFAVKCADSMLPPLVAIPVFALVRQWTRRTGAGNWIPACAALAAAAGAPALMMVGDFQKNSLALLWLASLLWSLHQWLEQPSFKRAALPVLFLGLLGVTHIGVFGWSLALTAPVMAIALWRSTPETRRALLPWVFVGGATCALAAGLVLWKFDPARITRLASAVAHPISYLQQGQAQPAKSPAGAPQFMPPSGFASGMPFLRPTGATSFFSRSTALAMNWNWVPTAMLLLASAGALAAVWFKRKSLPTATVAVLGACGLVLFAFCGPWVTGDQVMRFRLIAVGPALLCGSFALLQLHGPKLRNCLATVMALALLIPGIQRVTQGATPVITAEAAGELQAMSAQIAHPEKTLVVARHGLEWWTAWYLHTHIAHETALTAADWDQFDTVYFLRQKGGMPTLAGGMPQPAGVTNRTAWSRGFAAPGAVNDPRMPADGNVAHDGKFFTLASAPTPAVLASITNGMMAFGRFQ